MTLDEQRTETYREVMRQARIDTDATAKALRAELESVRADASGELRTYVLALEKLIARVERLDACVGAMRDEIEELRAKVTR